MKLLPWNLSLKSVLTSKSEIAKILILILHIKLLLDEEAQWITHLL